MISRERRVRLMSEPALIDVTVAFALPDRQWLFDVRVRAGATVQEAIVASGMTRHLGDVIPSDMNVGVFSRSATLTTVLNDGDRVEIYRPLTRDPKDTRRLRARAQKKR